MKILYVVTDLSATSGWSTYACNIIQEAINNDHEVCAVVEKEFPFFPERITQYPILLSPHETILHPIRIFRQWFRLCSVVKVTKPDLIHIIVEPYTQIFSLPLPLKSPIVLTLHGTYATFPLTLPAGIRRLMSSFFYKRALKRIKKIISVSEMTRRKFLNFVMYSEQDILVIHNSINTPKNQHRIQSNNHDKEVFEIITVGAVKRRKGIHTAIQLFSYWADSRRKKVTYHIVGSIEESSDYVKSVRRLAEESISEYFQVKFYGQIDALQKNTLLEGASLYVHLEEVIDGSGDVEGFGIGIIEAASYGVPALVAKGSATVEAVQEGLTGRIIDLNKLNFETNLTKIDSLILNEAPEMKRDTYAWAQQHASEMIFKKIDAVYTDVLK